MAAEQNISQLTESLLHAQTPEKQRTLSEALLAHFTESIKEEKISDEEALKNMTELFLKNLRVKPDLAMIFSDTVITYAIQTQKRKWEAKILNWQARHGINTAEYARSLDSANKSLVISESIADESGMADALNSIGIVHGIQGDYDKAINCFTQALKIQEDIGDKHGVSGSLGNLGNIYMIQGEFTKAMDNYKKTLKVRETLGDKTGVSLVLGNMGNIYYHLGDFAKAIDSHIQSMKIAEELGNIHGVAGQLMSISNIYSAQGDDVKEFEYLTQSLKIREKIGDKHGVSEIYGNIGNIYSKEGNKTEALSYYLASLKIKEEIGHKLGIATLLINIGNIYSAQGEYSKALDYSLQSLKIRESIGEKKGVALSWIGLGRLYQKQGMFQQALEYGQKAFALAKEISEVAVTREASMLLYQAHKNEGEFAKALEMHEEYITTRDQIAGVESQKSVMKTQMQYEFEKREAVLKTQAESKEKETEIQRLKNAELKKRNSIIREERKRSEELLLNILPRKTAQELKKEGKAKARNYKLATVFFSDFVDFTKTVEKLSSTELVNRIDAYFRFFDGVMKKYNIEKIKTIGDAYMAAGGLPVKNFTNHIDVVSAAVEILKFVKKQNDDFFRIRIGIHTGPLIAGVVGEHKFQYDIWGDTVNVAARMEQNSEPGKINISGATYELVKEKFKCIHRGKINAKNKGAIDMYFVNEIL